MKKMYLAALVLLAITTAGYAQSNKPLLMRNPTVSNTHIVFSYAGDLWIVPRAGGEAARLTTGTGTEGIPIFSPDGQSIAFTGEYDGNTDVYVVAATGGVPRRLTYHPGGDIATGWTPDGKSVVFRSGRNSESGRTSQLFTIPVDGVHPALVPLPMATDGSFSPDGSRLAYEPVPRSFQAWKRYRGGLTSLIWIANLADSSIEKLPRDNSNDFNPMWIDNRVYFLSDRSGALLL
jgi:tricorn protease